MSLLSDKEFLKLDKTEGMFVHHSFPNDEHITEALIEEIRNCQYRFLILILNSEMIYPFMDATLKQGVCQMAPSKLEKYLTILEALVLRPRKLDSIAYKTKMECNALKRHLDFLLSNGLVEERKLSKDQVVYAINERGISVYKTLRALKYLEKLKTILPTIEEAREVASVLTEHPREWREE